MDDKIPSDKLLGTTVVKDYEPIPEALGIGWGNNHISPNRPIFRPRFIPLMMSDPRIRLGISFIKGPIVQNVRFRIEANTEQVATFVQSQLDAFRLNGLSSALNSLVYGHSAHEVNYRQMADGSWVYAGVTRIAPADAKPVTVDGKIVGMTVNRTKQGKVYVPQPKSLWCVHQREENPWFGLPALYGAFEPWWETWCYRGYRDTRSIWFFKNAFSGPLVKYPTGATPIDRTMTGEPIMRANKSIADEIVDKMSTGTGASIPSSTNDNGVWDVQRGESAPVPEGLLSYGHDLADEKLEGLGVPPEVVTADGTGAYAGRAVPLQGFTSTLHDKACEVFSDFDLCVLQKLVLANPQLGPHPEYQFFVEGLYESSLGEELPEDGEEGIDGEEGMDDPGSESGSGKPGQQGQSKGKGKPPGGKNGNGKRGKQLRSKASAA